MVSMNNDKVHKSTTVISQNALAGALTLTSGRAPGPAPVSTGDGALSLDLIVGVTGIRYHRAVAHPIPH